MCAGPRYPPAYLHQHDIDISEVGAAHRYGRFRFGGGVAGVACVDAGNGIRCDGGNRRAVALHAYLGVGREIGEIRNDEIASAAGQKKWAELLAGILRDLQSGSASNGLRLASN